MRRALKHSLLGRHFGDGASGRSSHGIETPAYQNVHDTGVGIANPKFARVGWVVD